MQIFLFFIFRVTNTHTNTQTISNSIHFGLFAFSKSMANYKLLYENERGENEELRAENEELRAENTKLRTQIAELRASTSTAVRFVCLRVFV